MILKLSQNLSILSLIFETLCIDSFVSAALSRVNDLLKMSRNQLIILCLPERTPPMFQARICLEFPVALELCSLHFDL